MIALNDMVRKTTIDEEIVLLDGKSGAYFGLNEVGSRMLELSLLHADREAVIGALADEFEADEATIRKDLAELLDTLLAKELIVDHEA